MEYFYPHLSHIHVSVLHINDEASNKIHNIPAIIRENTIFFIPECETSQTNRDTKILDSNSLWIQLHDWVCAYFPF